MPYWFTDNEKKSLKKGLKGNGQVKAQEIFVVLQKSNKIKGKKKATN